MRAQDLVLTLSLAAACREAADTSTASRPAQLQAKETVVAPEQSLPGESRALACGTAEACYKKARRARRSSQPAQAARLYDQACDQGYLDGCYELAIQLRDGKGVDADPERAQELLEQACFGEHQAACDALGH